MAKIDNQRIAKNTIFLYFRMLVMLLIGLLTSRVTLHALGASDLGIANIVGGVVAMFTFLNGTLSGATQRFLTYALGERDEDKLQTTFSSAFLLHNILAIIMVVIIEVVGLWFLYNKLNIPDGRMNAAFWLFQFSAISCGLNITQVPYNACIVAHEKMGAFAYLSLFSVVAKLAIVYTIWIYDGDRLILYGFLWFCVGLISLLLYRIYCIRHFKECHYRTIRDKSLLKSMIGFAGWDTFGNLALTLGGQGVNILFNLFFGTIVNAANALAQMVTGHVMAFVSNFQTASKPQIVKLYASRDWDDMYHLVENTAKFSCFILLFLGIPVFVEIDTILKIWLSYGIPPYTADFIRIGLIQSFIFTLGRPMVAAMIASGKIKLPNLINGPVLLLTLPMTYIILYLGYSPVVAYAFNVLPWVFQVSFETWYIHHLTGKGGWKYIGVCLKVTLIMLATFIPAYLIERQIENIWYEIVFVTLTSSVVLSLLIYHFGLNRGLRLAMKGRVLNYLGFKRI